MTKANLKSILTAVRDIINRSSEIGIRKAQAAEKRADNAQAAADNAQAAADNAQAAAGNAQAAAGNAQTAANAAQATADNAQTKAENAQAATDINKEVLDCAFSSVATFIFDKQTSGRDTFNFRGFPYHKISDFNPAPEDVISFKGTNKFGDEYSDINIGNNCAEYGLFIIAASAGACSLPISETVTDGFTAPSAGLYGIYHYDMDDHANNAGTAEFTLKPSSLFLKSSTPQSTKKFKITVDDTGALSATEVTA